MSEEKEMLWRRQQEEEEEEQQQQQINKSTIHLRRFVFTVDFQMGVNTLMSHI
jgi:hypothetical protein